MMYDGKQPYFNLGDSTFTFTAASCHGWGRMIVLAKRRRRLLRCGMYEVYCYCDLCLGAENCCELFVDQLTRFLDQVLFSEICVE